MGHQSALWISFTVTGPLTRTSDAPNKQRLGPGRLTFFISTSNRDALVLLSLTTVVIFILHALAPELQRSYNSVDLLSEQQLVGGQTILMLWPSPLSGIIS